MLREFLKECLDEAYSDWLRDNKDEYSCPEEVWVKDFCEEIYNEYVNGIVREKDEELWFCLNGFMTYMLCKSILTGEGF